MTVNTVGVCGTAQSQFIVRDTLANLETTDTDQDGVVNTCDICPNTIPGSPVTRTGCPPVYMGDFDRDGDVDRHDFDLLRSCAGRADVPVSGDCLRADGDGDGDVDMDDFGGWQRCYAGE